MRRLFLFIFLVSCIIYIIIYGLAFTNPYSLLTQWDHSDLKLHEPIEQYAYGYKLILVWTPWFESKSWFWNNLGTRPLKETGCPEYRCTLTSDKDKVRRVDAILFHMRDLNNRDALPRQHNPEQPWVFLTSESPENTFIDDPVNYDSVFNWTITYKSDSDIQLPYGGIKPKNVSNINVIDYARNKTESVLWYVSNCHTAGTKHRTTYVEQLKRYTDVKIYGKCGEKDPCNMDGNCTIKLKKKYRFYLAFENSQCKEYITEKFWKTLEAGMVPIVLGCNMSDYTKVAPPDSFLHVDNFTSPQKLANYIDILMKNDDMYNKYHKWRLKYDVYLQWPSHLVCSLCQHLHENKTRTSKSYKISEYWGQSQNCW